MVSRVFEIFEEIVAIPHCSRDAKDLAEYLSEFGRRCGLEVRRDEAGNLLARKGEEPKLCLQAHYDMVCVGKAPQIETVEEEGWLRAVDSSLGADNGIGAAMMLALMERGEELEYLFTADEEIGLVGAKALELELRSGRMLNLDFEEEGVVCIGCAGGVDLIASGVCETKEDRRPAWRVSVSGLPGGHSGVDIDKGIPNAIKVLAAYLARQEDAALVSFRGGERRNSIPVHAEAIVRCEALGDEEGVEIEPLSEAPAEALADAQRWITLQATAPHGVVEYNEELGIPQSSLNLAQVSLNAQGCRIDYSLRAMSEEDLHALAQRTQSMLQRYGFVVKQEDAYPSWKPEINALTLRVEEIMRRRFPEVKRTAIHAGLECGILSKKYPQMQMASIGPTIENPHSTRERVKIDSVKKTMEVLEELVRRA